MLDSYNNVSDLNLTVGKPLQVESAGRLVNVDMEPEVHELTPFQTEIFALNLINQDRRLTDILLKQGSCDLSYSLAGKARFRVNIFSQSGNYSVVLRKLESKFRPSGNSICRMRLTRSLRKKMVSFSLPVLPDRGNRLHWRQSSTRSTMISPFMS